jgi:uncharacterized membrane protein YccC
MKWFRLAAVQLIGLFVDDWGLALLVLAWIGAMGAVSRHVPPALAGSLLFAGFAVITLAFVHRRARAGKK